ncbi:MAG: GDP-mannose 4,6-dehydratase [Gemmatimonadaceae bacterium]
MRALVTGAAGFVGRWLTALLIEQGWDVTGSTNTAAPHPAASRFGEIAAAGTAAGAATGDARAIRWVEGDMRDPHDIGRMLDTSRPDAVFHLAGVSFVPAAGGDPGQSCDVNVSGTARLLHSVVVRRAAGTVDPVVLIVGSSEQYGRHDASDLPLAEDAAQRPLTVYGASKSAQEVMALQAFRSNGVRVVCTRSFGHSGPGQSPGFLFPSLVRRALELRGVTSRSVESPRLAIGNVNPVRDYLHVADVARAYLLLAERGEAGAVYNVSSGVGQAVGALAAAVLRRTGVDARIVADDSLVRAVDVPALVGDSARLRRTTGWSPSHDTDDIIDDLIHAATH